MKHTRAALGCKLFENHTFLICFSFAVVYDPLQGVNTLVGVVI